MGGPGANGAPAGLPGKQQINARSSPDPIDLSTPFGALPTGWWYGFGGGGGAELVASRLFYA